MYLRELPEALFTSLLYKKFFEAFSKLSCWLYLKKQYKFRQEIDLLSNFYVGKET